MVQIALDLGDAILVTTWRPAIGRWDARYPVGQPAANGLRRTCRAARPPVASGATQSSYKDMLAPARAIHSLLINGTNNYISAASCSLSRRKNGRVGAAADHQLPRPGPRQPRRRRCRRPHHHAPDRQERAPEHLVTTHSSFFSISQLCIFFF
jgi:hypothetical protein